VPYPKGARGDAVVLLELTIERDGTVFNAVVMEGVEPFATQARETVLGWRFTPALRGSNPVRALIRARVEFRQVEVPRTPPGATPPPARGPTLETSSGSAQPAAEAPEEVNVHGTRREIGQTTLSATDIREMPGAFGDAFRAIEALPGVVPIASGIPFFYIRGAPQNDNGYYIDGIRVPLLFHVGVGQAVIPPALVDHVDFFPGAAPASYGGFAGSSIAGQTREPASTLHGEATLRVIDAGALVETPFADGRGTALVAARYGYPGLILSAITSDIKLGYWDYQARASWRLTDRDTIGLFAFGSHDTLSTEPSSSNTFVNDFNSDFHRVDLRYDHALVDGHLRVAVTGGYDSQGAVSTNVTDASLAARLEIDKRLSATLRVRGGADARLDVYGFEQGAGTPSEPVVPSTATPPPTDVTSGAHADVVWRMVPRVEVVPGVRADVFESTRTNPAAGSGNAATTVPALDPRLATRVTMTPEVAWLSTFGLAHQYPALRVGLPASLVPPGFPYVPGFPFGQSQLQSVAQASQGVEVALPLDFVLTATGFLSGWSGLTDLTANCVQIMPGKTKDNESSQTEPYVCPDNQGVHGIAFGGELLVRRPFTKRLSGWLSYTLSRSTRDTNFITPSGGTASATVPSEGDRTHVVNAILAYDLGRHWHAGARFVFFTGQPYSNMMGNIPVPPYNDERYPPFFRLDVRLEKRWLFARGRSIAFIVEGQNVTLSKEGYGIDCRTVGTPTMPTTTRCGPGTIGPITIPSIGVEAVF
jgi:hypothetical protein